jgi:hypothetical protein
MNRPKLKRDRWNDRGETLDDPFEELKRLASRLEDQREMHRADCKALANAERDEAEGLAVTADEFRGTIAFDEADRQRAERSARTVAARKQADRSGELVKVGEKLCDEQARKIAHARHTAVLERQRRVEREIAQMEASLTAKRRDLPQLDAEAESWTYSGQKWLELQALFSPSARSTLEIRELQRQAQQLPPETPDEARERQAAALLGARTLNYEGEQVAAYTRLPSGDGGPVRISP